MAVSIRNKKAFYREKGIFCIEGSWVNDHRSRKSVKTALDFLECIEGTKVIIKQCQNIPTLKELLSDSMLSSYKKYAIIYLAFHGKPGLIQVGKRGKTASLDDIADAIGDRANGKIIHFGCCSTLNINGWEARKFLKKTNALAISGYQVDIDFVKSTAFDLLYFQQCQKNHDIAIIKRNMNTYYSKISSELGFIIRLW